MAIYYYCSNIKPGTKCWEELKNLLNLDLEGKRRKITYISGNINDKSKSKSYRNSTSKNLSELGIDMEDYELIYRVPLSAEELANNVNRKSLNNITSSEMQDHILESDIVYLQSGNPLDQMAYITSNSLIETLKAYKGIIMGQCSGLMTMSKNIIVPPYHEPYDSDAIIQEGLNLAGISCFPHVNYDINQDTCLMSTTSGDYVKVSDLLEISKQYEMLGLSDNTILRCSGEEVYALGDKPYLLQNGAVHETSIEETSLDNIPVKKLVLK